MKLVIASNNKHKIAEIKAILSGKFEEILSLSEAGIEVDPEENGETFCENALIKARACQVLAGCACLADDSGLMVDALSGEPGVHSARYAGEPCDDAKNNEKLLKNLEGVADRTAHFVSVVALVDGVREVTAEGRTSGRILHEGRGTGGFGYDPLFYSDELQKTYAEATAEEKNGISHRAKALSNLVKII